MWLAIGSDDCHVADMSDAADLLSPLLLLTGAFHHAQLASVALPRSLCNAASHQPYFSPRHTPNASESITDAELAWRTGRGFVFDHHKMVGVHKRQRTKPRASQTSNEQQEAAAFGLQLTHGRPGKAVAYGSSASRSPVH